MTQSTNPPGAVLFDLDGTLIDSIELILESFRHTRRVHFGDALPDDIWLGGIGTRLSEQFAPMAESPADIDAMVATFREHNLAHHDALVKVYDGIVEVVEELSRRGHGLALVTSKLRPGASMGLELLGLTQHFGVTVCAGDVEHGKPHPEPVLTACRLLGVEPQGALFIGDSPHDMLSGRAAGTRTAGVLWGPFSRDVLLATEPTHLLERPRDILEIV